MNTCLSVLAVSAMLVAGVALTPAYAQGTLEVMTDKASYSDGETVQVTGQVGQILQGEAVALTVITPPPISIVQVEQLTVAGDGTFEASIVAGSLWKNAGDYTVRVTYGGNNAETTLAFGGSSGIVTPTPSTPDPAPGTGGMDPMTGSLLPPGSPTMALAAPDDNVMLGYSITGGSLLSITPDVDSMSIVIGIDADDDGSLIIDFPREVLDARLGDDKCSGEDDSFIVLVDLEERSFEESSTDVLRSLSIPFEAGASQIEIIGTCVIPEFGTIAVMILAVAVVAIVAMTARSRLSILPRY